MDHIAGHPPCEEAGHHICSQPSLRLCVDCDQPAGTLWGPFWCVNCDSRRLARIGASLEALLDELGNR